MKRFLSILIALVMLVSMFAVSAVAIAEEQSTPPATEDDTPEAREVTFDPDAFRQYVKTDDLPQALEMDRSFMLENKWWEDADKVNAIFNGINYRVQPKEELKDEEGNDKTVKYVVHYVVDGEVVAENYTVPADAEYVDTQHFKLPTTPTIGTHKETVQPQEDEDGEATEKDVPNAYFAGWQITLGYTPETSGDDNGEVEGTALETLPAHLDGVFASGAEIAMPAENITVTAVFKDTEEEAKSAVNKPDDKLYLLYVSPSGASTEDSKDWSRCLVTSTFSLTSEGEWNFRFAVVDGEKASQSGYSFDWDDVLATSYDNIEKIIEEAESNGTSVNEKEVKAQDCTLTFRTKDTTAPQIKLSTTQENKQVDGLTVGTTYSVSTSLDITDCSSTTVTYVVYKQVGADKEGADDEGWLQIYDSKTREVAEGYEDNISTSGVITPLDEDVTGKNVYKIVYTVVDSFGNHGVQKVSGDEVVGTDEYHPTMLLKVSREPVAPNTKTEAWKIVLYVIAGLSALGIIVLLCIKPKEQKADARYNVAIAGNTDSTDSSDSTEETDKDDDTVE